MTEPRHLAPTEAAARAIFTRGFAGPVVMLNLLRFRPVTDYAESPELTPPTPIPGAEAYAIYTAETLPLLTASGGEVLFEGSAERWFIGPEQERWDHMLLVRQASLEAFRAFASDPVYLRILGHRTAALEDSRLLPVFAER